MAPNKRIGDRSRPPTLDRDVVGDARGRSRVKSYGLCHRIIGPGCRRGRGVPRGCLVPDAGGGSSVVSRRHGLWLSSDELFNAATRVNDLERAQNNRRALTREAAEWLIEQGTNTTAIDAPLRTRALKSRFRTTEFWPGHMDVRDRQYCHLENMASLDATGRPFRFEVSVLGLKWKMTTATPVRAVAILEDWGCSKR